MQYKVTKQYARDSESPLAEFNDINDAKLFIEEKIDLDALLNTKIIFRLFDRDHLINEFNKEKINVPISRAQYAEGDAFIPKSFSFSYKVTGQSQQAVEKPLAEFNNVEDAKIFINAKLSRDAMSQLAITYQLFSSAQLMEKFEPIDSSFKTQSQGQKNAASFRPTPLSTTPRPLGTPPKWLIDEEDDNEKKK